MPTDIVAPALIDDGSNASEITDAHFGTVLVGNYLFQDDENRLEQDSTMDEGLDELGVTSIRFPGGTESWNGTFDYENPEDVAELHEVIDYCAAENLSLQFTIPVRWFLTGEIDEDGNRTVEMSDEDIENLATFIEVDLLGYAAEMGVTVETIKLDNEFLAATDGEDFGLDLSKMTPEEYGRAASAVAIVVGEAVESFEENNPFAESVDSPQIVLELPSWTDGIDRMLENIEPEAAAYITAIDTHNTHLSLDATYDELLGTDSSDETWRDDQPVSETYDSLIAHMDEVSSDYGFGELTYLNEAWAVDSAGLDNLGQAILTFHAMSLSGIESATLWTAAMGGDYTAFSAAFTDGNGGHMRALGELFQQMETHLKGMQAVELDTGLTGAEELEQDYLIRAFYDEGRTVFYVINPQPDQDEINLDISQLLASIPGFEDGYADIEAIKIGVKNDDYDEFYARPETERYGDEDLGLDSTVDGITLNGYEVLQISVTADGEFGTDGDDTISLGNADNWIFGYEGNDEIVTGKGDDRIDAGSGNDHITSGSGADIITAGSGDDIVISGYGTDEVDLGDGNDVFYDEVNQFDEWGADFVNGGDGDDVIFGGGGADTFLGGNGNDWIDGGSESDLIEGDNGDDTLLGGDGGDFIRGGEGNDLIYGGSSSDTILGGNGNDEVWGDNGSDLVHLDGGDDIFWDNGQSSPYGNDTVYGGDGNDTIHGAGGDDTFFGDAGEDYIEGGEGNDEIHGGAQYDTIFAGEGNDLVWGDSGRDTVYLEEGDDLFWDSEQSGAHGRDTVYGGDGDDTIYGAGGDDTFFGDAGEDYIEGGEGNDEIHGGAQYDTIFAGDGDDVVWGDSGRDTVHLGDGDDIFWDSEQTGSHGRDTVYGGEGDDQIHIAGGNDWVSGGSGADTFIFEGTIDNNEIYDFSAAEGDVLDFSSYNLANVDELKFAEDANGVLLTVGKSGSVYLDGISEGDLTPDCFVF